MDPSQEDIRFVEPSPIDSLMPVPITWETWAMIGGAILTVILLICFVWRNKRQQAPSPEDIYKKAHDEAIAAFALCPTQERTPAATECSLILRRYLATVTGDPALFETHDEWIARHDAMDAFDEGIKAQIHELFEQLANWKYAPAEHGDEPKVMIDRSRQILETINRELAA